MDGDMPPAIRASAAVPDSNSASSNVSMAGYEGAESLGVIGEVGRGITLPAEPVSKPTLLLSRNEAAADAFNAKLTFCGMSRSRPPS